MSNGFLNVPEKDIRLMFWDGSDLVSKFAIRGFIPQAGQVLSVPRGTHNYASEQGIIDVKVLEVKVSLATVLSSRNATLDVNVTCEVVLSR